MQPTLILIAGASEFRMRGVQGEAVDGIDNSAGGSDTAAAGRFLLGAEPYTTLLLHAPGKLANGFLGNRASFATGK